MLLFVFLFRFLCSYTHFLRQIQVCVLARQRPRLPCVKGAVTRTAWLRDWQPLRAKSKILPTSPYTGEALVRCATVRQIQVCITELYFSTCSKSSDIVGANCVRPRAVTDRPYIFFRKLFVKFKFVKLHLTADYFILRSNISLNMPFWYESIWMVGLYICNFMILW